MTTNRKRKRAVRAKAAQKNTSYAATLQAEQPKEEVRLPVEKVESTSQGPVNWFTSHQEQFSEQGVFFQNILSLYEFFKGYLAPETVTRIDLDPRYFVALQRNKIARRAQKEGAFGLVVFHSRKRTRTPVPGSRFDTALETRIWTDTHRIFAVHTHRDWDHSLIRDWTPEFCVQVPKAKRSFWQLAEECQALTASVLSQDPILPVDGEPAYTSIAGHPSVFPAQFGPKEVAAYERGIETRKKLGLYRQLPSTSSVFRAGRQEPREP